MTGDIRALPAAHAEIWGRVADHVAYMLARPTLFDLDSVRSKHMLHLWQDIAPNVDRGDPVSRDALERLAAAAIHWALDLPEPDPDKDHL